MFSEQSLREFFLVVKKLFASTVCKSRRIKMPLKSKGVAIYKSNTLFLPENSISVCHCICSFAYLVPYCLTVLSVPLATSTYNVFVCLETVSVLSAKYCQSVFFNLQSLVKSLVLKLQWKKKFKEKQPKALDFI